MEVTFEPKNMETLPPDFPFTRKIAADKLPLFFPEKAEKKRIEREKEIERLAAETVLHHYTNEEFLKEYATKEELEELTRLQKSGDDFVLVREGPIRTKPGLVGVWRQEALHEWRQVGVYNYFYLRSNCKDEKYRHGQCLGLASGRTARILLWMDDDVSTHYMSAFYSPDEWNYILNERPTYDELLDCSVCYVSEDSIYSYVRNMPLCDIMYLALHGFHELRDHVKDFVHYFRYKLIEMRENKTCEVYHLFPNVVRKDEPSTYERQEELLRSFLYRFNLLEKFGLYKDEYIEFEKNGGIEDILREAKKYREYLDAGGQIGVSMEWMVAFMTKKSLDEIKERMDFLKYWYDEELSLRNFLIGDLYKVGPLCQCREEPVYDDSNDGYWQEILYRYSDTVDRKSRDANASSENMDYTLGRKLTDDEISELKVALSIFSVTPEAYWSMDEKALRMHYISVIKEKHPDQGGSDAYATKINTSYEFLKKLKRMFG